LFAKGAAVLAAYPKREDDPPFSNKEPPFTFAKREELPSVLGNRLDEL
jgi:hypothetical protein